MIKKFFIFIFNVMFILLIKINVGACTNIDKAIEKIDSKIKTIQNNVIKNEKKDNIIQTENNIENDNKKNNTVQIQDKIKSKEDNKQDYTVQKDDNIKNINEKDNSIQAQNNTNEKKDNEQKNLIQIQTIVEEKKENREYSRCVPTHLNNTHQTCNYIIYC